MSDRPLVPNSPFDGETLPPELMTDETAFEPMPEVDPDKLARFKALLEARARILRQNKAADLKPWPKQAEFLAIKARVKVMTGGNRVGKTFWAAFEVMCHMTGIYPDWWVGRKFTKPVSVWCAGKSGEATRDIMQLELLGNVAMPEVDPTGAQGLGTGMIPGHLIHPKFTWRHNVPGAVETFWVKHVSGGWSMCTLKSYEQGFEKFMGVQRHVIWLDEEPEDYRIFSECKMRTIKTGNFPGGIIIATFTPLHGVTKLYLELTNSTSGHVGHVRITWDDVGHLSQADKDEMVADMPEHERLARIEGLPSSPTGRVYPFATRKIQCDPFPIPNTWPVIYGLDNGFASFSALARIAVQPMPNRAGKPLEPIFYLTDVIKVTRCYPEDMARLIRPLGKAPLRIDPASNKLNHRRSGSDIKEFREALEGWDIRNANNAVLDGIKALSRAMKEGRFFVFSTCAEWFKEFETYMWDENAAARGESAPKKTNDHLMDATRYAFQAREDAVPIIDSYMMDLVDQDEYRPYNENTYY